MLCLLLRDLSANPRRRRVPIAINIRSQEEPCAMKLGSSEAQKRRAIDDDQHKQFEILVTRQRCVELCSNGLGNASSGLKECGGATRTSAASAKIRRLVRKPAVFAPVNSGGGQKWSSTKVSRLIAIHRRCDA